jgi:hypothetical protein
MRRIYISTLCALAGTTACSGKDGANGKDGLDGLPGENGPAGKDGSNGKDGVAGKDGTNNRFKEHVYCSGTIATGHWVGVKVEYSAYQTTAGDVLSHSTVVLGEFTQSASNSYSVKQVGASTAPVFVTLDKGTTFRVAVNRTDNKVEVEIFNGTYPDKLTFNSSACQVQSY